MIKINKVFLIGHLTRKPELRYTQSNTPVASFSLAVNRTYANAEGEREADFINIVVWRKQAENVGKYLDKGSKVAIDGSIQTRKYQDNDGNNKIAFEVIANNVEFLNNKNSEKVNASIPEKSEPLQNPVQQKSVFEEFGDTVEIVDEDLPW